jgi:hypothetical protein
MDLANDPGVDQRFRNLNLTPEALVEANLKQAPAFWQASIMRRADWTSRVSGFSQNTCLPCAAAARTPSSWNRLGVATITASRLHALSMASSSP